MFFPFVGFRPDQVGTRGGGGYAFTAGQGNMGLPSATGFRPIPKPEKVGTLDVGASVIGTGSFQQNAGTTNHFLGTATKIYRHNGANDSSLEDVSVGGGSFSSATWWNFCIYGSTVIATNDVDEIHSYNNESGAGTDFAVLDSNAPTCRYVAAAKNFVFAANTQTGPDYVQWCAQGDETDWPTPGTADAISKLSDRRQLIGDGGDITGIKSDVAGCDILIFRRRGLTRGTFVGGDTVWQFDNIEGGIGCVAESSIVVHGGVAYYLGEPGWCAFDGLKVHRIGEGKIDRWFWEDGNWGFGGTPNRCFGCAIPKWGVIIWAYADKDSAGTTHTIAYSVETGEWAFNELTDDWFGNTGTYINFVVFPYMKDTGQDAWGLGWCAFDGTSENNVFRSIPTDTDTIQGLQFTMTTQDLAVGNWKRMQINGAIPYIESESAVPSTSITLTPYTRERPDQALTAGTGVNPNGEGVCRFRASGRLIRLEVDIAHNTRWKQITGVEIPDDMMVERGGR